MVNSRIARNSLKALLRYDRHERTRQESSGSSQETALSGQKLTDRLIDGIVDGFLTLPKEDNQTPGPIVMHHVGNTLNFHLSIP